MMVQEYHTSNVISGTCDLEEDNESIVEDTINIDSVLQSDADNAEEACMKDIETDENGGAMKRNQQKKIQVHNPEESINNKDNIAGESETAKESASEEIPVEKEADGRTLFYMVKIPRHYEESTLRKQIEEAHARVDEEATKRNSIQAQRQATREKCKELSQAFKSARSARGLVLSKRKEMETFNAVIDKVRAASYVDEINDNIRNMERRMQHETLSLDEEKHLISEIKGLKQERDQAASSSPSEEEIKEANGKKEHAEEQLKVLKKEAALLRKEAMQAEEDAKSADQMMRIEQQKLKELDDAFEKANAARQEAFVNLQRLKKECYEKRKHFPQYKCDVEAAKSFVFSNDKQGLALHCDSQVERMMQLWNNDAVFRNDYVKSNVRSTIWRLGTFDGRSLAPNESPPALNYKTEPIKPESVAEDKGKPSVENDRDNKRENVQDEEEKRKQEEQREAGVAVASAKLKEEKRIAEKIKAQEAMERKRKLAERARIRAAIKAQREAEMKEKMREKKAKKKEMKTEIVMEDDVNGEELSMKVVETIEVKKQQKQTSIGKQVKKKPVAPPQRQRVKKNMQMWVWGGFIALLLIIFFLFTAVAVGKLSF